MFEFTLYGTPILISFLAGFLTYKLFNKLYVGLTISIVIAYGMSFMFSEQKVFFTGIIGTLLYFATATLLEKKK
ncbi:MULTISPECIES: hypothetical protein [Bacillus]|uniref:Uncharacterized protein n=2 Tax=Bacillus cereus group TaxID=86661 RepID=Q72XZ3_BACC1|nr:MULTISPECIES: hypothetical protein [Bacillus]AAS44131.1 hypothetical protein BCE_5230 [Bacillus cereus ATCC 10987]KMQ29372.1 hypothetical protein TU53_21465 [Bacillus cereus]KXY78412.1 hypothetical protein AT272_03800 [Bacillus cereus]KYQ04606.1 hypothetical protein B4079_0242 [Bacillus cereus]MCU5155672.1 hypothetical protein [Bacillus pacificus]